MCKQNILNRLLNSSHYSDKGNMPHSYLDGAGSIAFLSIYVGLVVVGGQWNMYYNSINVVI